MSFACASWTQDHGKQNYVKLVWLILKLYFTQNVCSIYLQVLAREGLRVISVNTNYCNNFNFWLALNFNDPHKHLHWLYQELKKAEDNRESVYILGHIPTGSESCTGKKWGLICELWWWKNYIKISGPRMYFITVCFSICDPKQNARLLLTPVFDPTFQSL